LGIVRLVSGLGGTTNLSDAYPWGLWIIYDVFFVPFSAGAFMILAVTHIYNHHEYSGIARPVVLAGFLGEVMVIAVLVMDLGRWHQFYNVLFPWNWNVRSFMFQVSICLTIYMGIMLLELAPVGLERLKWQKPLRLIRPATVAIALAGIVLSSLHQSSLGSLFLLMPYKVNALWWTPLLPLQFFAAAAISGLAMAIFVAVLSFRGFGRRLDLGLLAKLAQVTAIMLGLYLVLKVGDLLVSGELGLVFSQGSLSALWWAEMIIGVLVPMVLFGVRRFRESSVGLVAGAGCILLGLALNRTSVALLAQTAQGAAVYHPHWIEITISLAAVAAGVLIFVVATRVLPVLPRDEKDRGGILPAYWPRWAVAGVAALLVLCTVAVVFLMQPVVQAEASRIRTEATPAAQQPMLSDRLCRECHLDGEALLDAGAQPDQLERLVVEPQPPDTAHGRLACTTCHHGDAAGEDHSAIHGGVVVDPSQGVDHICEPCHRDVADEFPEDRLKTLHDEVQHGLATDVYCSDCHGAAGHGFDPVAGGVYCTMATCLECHEACDLPAEQRDCDTCHLGPHNVDSTTSCCQCHRSMEAWEAVEVEGHPLALDGTHGTVACNDCHEASASPQPDCAGCHQASDPPHYGPTCQDCHTTSGFGDARLPAEQHPTPQEGAHAQAPCEGCHGGDAMVPATACEDCHARPEGHLSGDCEICHTPAGWSQSIAWVVALSPQVPHGLEGQEACLACHDPAGDMMPAPSNHGDYGEVQCTLCHKGQR
jgi:Ni/Fe-hydrogenase subunit HybB-like protein